MNLGQKVGHLKVYVVGCGILYGNGEDVLFT